MNPELLVVCAILAGAAVLFASNRVRLDVVALLTVMALMLTGVMTPREALAGFGDPIVLLVAGLLVVGETLTRTGVAYSIGRWISRRAGSSETRLLVLMMGIAGLLGSVMSSTAVVAILIPVVLTLATRSNLNASRLLLPLSYGALISGMLTLIATTPNLVVSAELSSQGYEPFAFFSFLPVGLAVLAVGIAYILVVGRRLLPGEELTEPRTSRQTLDDLARGFGLEELRQRLRVLPGSPLIGRTLAQSGLSEFHVRVIGIERAERFGTAYLTTPDPSLEIHVGDVLAAAVQPESVPALVEAQRLEILAVGEEEVERWRQVFGSAVVLVHPESSLIGCTLRDTEFRSRHGIHVQGLRRAGQVLQDFEGEPLAAGDTLLVQGQWHRIATLQGDTHDFVVLMLPLELDQVAPARQRAPLALLILAGMVLLSAFEIVPVVVAVLLAALATVFTRCLSMDDGYRAIHWSSLVLIAGMLPLADALQKTGGVELIIDGHGSGLGDVGPVSMLSVVFFLTAGLGLVLSNTASAVIMAPIAIQAAELLAVSPRPFAMGVAIAASAAFVTPVSTPVVTLVVEPGGYRFGHFLKAGLPLLLLTWLTTLLVVPVFFPY
jgi:di/tricarboxylate transporter